MRKLAATGAVAAVTLAVVLAAGGAAADTFAVRLISQTNTTITLGWDPRPGYGYLFSSAGVLRSRTNDAKRSTVRFSKGLAPYEVAVIVKGGTGTYPDIEPAKVECNDRRDNDGDGKTDYPADPDCTTSGDKSESGTAPPPPPPPTTTTPTTPVPPPPSTGSFPNAASTGVPSGTSLTAYTGPQTVSVANTVIDGKTIGCLVVTAPGVVIKNSRVSCSSSYYAVYVDDRTSQSMVLTIQDSEISCGNSNNIGVGEADYTILRTEITGCENGLDINQNVLVQDSFIHNLTTSGGDPHTDGAQLADHYDAAGNVIKGAVNVTFRHNTIFGMGGNDTVFGTSAIIQNVNATDTNVTIDNNLLAGGAYTLYCHSPGPAVNNRITNNHFSTRFKATVGYFGPTDGCGDEAVVSGNVIDETGQPVNMG